MYHSSTVRRFAVALATAAFIAGIVPASAQNISEGHLKAARAALSALNATAQYDSILPHAAATLKGELIQKDPNLQELIINTVDEKTLELASRRGDLEREAALAYARTFTEEELNAIAAFYNTEPGKKLLKEGTIVITEVMQAADIWQRGLARDLAVAVGQSLQKDLAANAPAVTAPAAPAAPAPAAPAQ